eukprot:1815465-Heterocapsa_arctica.AAC.1
MSAKPRAARRKWITMNVKVVGVTVEAVVRSSETPETLGKASVDHTSARALKDVKIRTLDHGITLWYTGTTGFMQDLKLPTCPDDFTGA